MTGQADDGLALILGIPVPRTPADDDREYDWRDDALCAQSDPEMFFPDKGGSTREAKSVCRSCDVRAQCLAYAFDNDERFGIWGGLSEFDRRKLRRQNEKPCIDCGAALPPADPHTRYCAACDRQRDRGTA